MLIPILCFTALPGCESPDEEKEEDSGDDDDSVDDDDLDDDDDDDQLPAVCDEIYQQDNLPLFEIQIAQSDWDELLYNYQYGMEIPEPRSYFPLIEFRYGDETISNAAIRLRGSPDHWWPDPKMQFNISFKQYDEDGRFRGMRKLNLDNAHGDHTIFHDRLGMQFFRDLGVPAPCVNHAKLNINGEYFGLYVNIEHVDQEFLRRNFGKQDEGNLYKSMSHFIYEKKTNESDPDMSDVELFEADLNLDELDAITDLDEAIVEWAGEALAPHLDGYFAGAVNYYLYNHPQRGFIFIPWDIDYSFDLAPYELDLIDFVSSWGHGKPKQFLTVLTDNGWYQRYLSEIERARTYYDPELLNQRIDLYADQIEDAMATDPNPSFTLVEHQQAESNLRQHIAKRWEFSQGWLNCAGGEVEHQTLVAGSVDYQVITTPCSWNRARENCELLGGDLAVPRNADEQTLLSNALFSMAPGKVWIGANDLTQEGLWTDAAGNPLSHLFWGPGQPSEHDHIDCVQMIEYYDGLWSDDYCARPRPSVCTADK
ncbi:MAG: CotH kinase family protein [Candidatus Alcyoniella australis]|nr:CotH kinase family protein [Candidatus Alcyoniella australis]